jgi:hypothetical protein
VTGTHLDVAYDGARRPLRQLSVAVDPSLGAASPEIHWTLRLLLAGMGFAWREVPLVAADADLAYVAAARETDARVQIRADPDRWTSPSAARLAGVSRDGDWLLPVFEGERPHSALVWAADGRLRIERDVVFDVFWLATGQQEAGWALDKHGHFEPDPSFPREVFDEGLASQIGARLEEALADGGRSEPLPRWPGDARAAACMSHDVDYPEVVRWLEPLRIVRRRGLHANRQARDVLLGRRTHWHFGSWMDLEERYGVRSSFYFASRQGHLVKYALGTPDPLYDVGSTRFARLFDQLAERGFEIGLHASYRACEQTDGIAAEKAALERAAHREVTGCRHHYWHLRPGDPESTLLQHEEAGLAYDTSLAHERFVGWRRGLSWPFFPFHQRQRRELRTLQLSPAWMDDQLFGYRADNPGERMEVLRALVDRTIDQRGCFVVDIHEYVFDDELFPGWSRTYRELLEDLAGRSDLWIETPARVAEHWARRHELIVGHSQGLDGGRARPATSAAENERPAAETA